METYPESQKCDFLSVPVVLFLVDLRYVFGAKTGDMVFEPSYVLKYAHHYHRLNCMVGLLLSASEPIDVVQGGYLHRYLLDSSFRPACSRLQHMNRFLDDMATPVYRVGLSRALNMF